MADPKDNDPKANDGKTGPVKPPVLDLKARETEKPASKPASPEAKPGPRPAQARPVASQPGFALGAAVTGGAIGLAAAYGLAWFGLWPTTSAPAPAADPRLAQFAAAIPELETVTQTTQSELAALNQRIATLETAAPASSVAAVATEPPDVSGILSDIAALSGRIDSLAATPAPVADADAGALDTLRTDLAALTTRLDEVAARLGTAEAGLRTLDTTVSQTSATLASQPSDIGAVLQLPLILSGLETAFASGRAYGTELAALRAAMPDATIPGIIADNATNGLVRPDIIARRFDELLPAMLAGRPANPDAQWQDGALDWFRSAIALRPTGEMEGGSPEAIMSRLEGAVARRDFIEAEALLSALPPQMQAAGGDLPQLVGSQAEAGRFLESLRASALSGEAAP